MKPLEHTGDSANTSSYAEKDQEGQYVWAEVLCDWNQRGPRGIGMIRRNVPVFYVRISQFKVGRTGEFTYRPRRVPDQIPLPGSLVTRLVRQHYLPPADLSDADEDRGLRYGGDGVIADDD